MLVLIPLVGNVYTAWSGYGFGAFLLRGIVAVLCLLPPTLLMGATLPALSRGLKTTPEGISWLGLFYTANILGAVFGCLFAGFYLLREYDVFTATFIAAAINIAVAGIAFLVAVAPTPAVETISGEQHPTGIALRDSSAVYVAIGLSGFSALAAEAVWTPSPSSCLSSFLALQSAAALHRCCAAVSSARLWRWAGASCSLEVR
jgi:spermidine synthase